MADECAEGVMRQSCAKRRRFQLIFKRRVAFQDADISQQRHWIGMMKPVILRAYEFGDFSRRYSTQDILPLQAESLHVIQQPLVMGSFLADVMSEIIGERTGG